MEWLSLLLDYILRIDVHLNDLILRYGEWTYGILFVIIFCETGLVVTPFLPGDSLLFAAGAFASKGSLDSMIVFVLLSAAAILGDSLNYWAGSFVGPKVFHAGGSRFFKKEYLDRTHAFYERHGGKTIILARFIPIIRTFAPFVAGIGSMRYGYFLAYNIIGGIAWVGFFVFGGYYFGTMPAVKNNFTLVIVAIIIISTLPAAFEFLRHRAARRKEG